LERLKSSQYLAGALSSATPRFDFVKPYWVMTLWQGSVRVTLVTFGIVTGILGCANTIVRHVLLLLLNFSAVRAAMRLQYSKFEPILQKFGKCFIMNNVSSIKKINGIFG
jgi:hypothetical protein